jgi:hypothetical protein
MLCEKERIECFVTAPTSVEGYFLSAEHLSKHNTVSSDAARRFVSEATLKCEGPDVQRIASSSLVQVGRLANAEDDASAMYRDDPPKWRHAKTVLGHTKSLIQKEQRRNAVVYKSSEHLGDPLLMEIAEHLWKVKRV